jgi:hypothetical protein
MQCLFCSSVQNYNFIADIMDIAFSTKIKEHCEVLLVQDHIKIASMGNIIETVNTIDQQTQDEIKQGQCS